MFTRTQRLRYLAAPICAAVLIAVLFFVEDRRFDRNSSLLFALVRARDELVVVRVGRVGWRERVVPFTVEFVAGQGQRVDVAGGVSEPGGVFGGVEHALNCQPGCGGGMANQVHNHLVRAQGAATPIVGDLGEQAVLDLVPFARSRWQMADGDGQAGLGGSPASSIFHARMRLPFEPPLSAQMSSLVASG